MRTATAMLAEFDSPDSSLQPANGIASPISSVRERLALEVLLDIREALVELNILIGECKEELVEIKANTGA